MPMGKLRGSLTGKSTAVTWSGSARSHAEHDTVLIETFSYERAEGKLIRNLTEKLAAHGVSLSPIPRDKVFAVLEEQGRVDPFTRLLATFLQHFKGSRMSFAEIAERAATLPDGRRAESFLAVFRPIFERYQETLARSGAPSTSTT